MIKLILLLCLICIQVIPQKRTFHFQLGDLLFQDCQCGPICEAIEDVNEENDKRRFSHMAIVSQDSQGI